MQKANSTGLLRYGMSMCNTESKIGESQYYAFCLDYEALKKRNLGIPNCLHCGTEPNDALVITYIYCGCDMHVKFVPCNHTVGVELWRRF
ncbi:hypothetical protein HUN41_00026 [Streptomyces phage Coruscant]|uniref:Uncharacterized protein n=1 Tax=Streptomyces phage Coruscant TaxID=2739834 RepID=A0A7G4AVW6_9CAUD|nr:hypothetical protein PP454_gp026 [Streptomyces phage Coruscant]QMP84156.1 hypothetical protein HUN41_00026 [Streptomyces phage Coruscant]